MDEPEGKRLAQMIRWASRQVAGAFVLLMFLIALLLILPPGDGQKQDCEDGTPSGYCSADGLFLCQNGAYIIEPSRCTPPAPVETGGIFTSPGSCSDGTPDGECSDGRPYYCRYGKLVPDPALCGCPEGQMIEGDRCIDIIYCSDGTQSASCSDAKPSFCDDGVLVQDAPLCGCPDGFFELGDGCREMDPDYEYRSYEWMYEGESFRATLPFRKDLPGKFAAKPRGYTCYGGCESGQLSDYYQGLIDTKDQEELIKTLVSRVQYPDPDRRLMILLALVQSIPYDWDTAFSGIVIQKYPLETLYYDAGVCSDKSLLGAAIAKELGYGVSLMEYYDEGHMAMGLRCPEDLSNHGTGYCFLDVTSECNRLSDDRRTYLGNITLSSSPDIFVVGEGRALGPAIVQKDIDARRGFEDAASELEVLEPMLQNASDPQTYNAYAEEYNRYAAIYNSYLDCNGRYG